MKKEIELLNQTETALLRLMEQYQSGQYVTLGACVSNVRAVRETLRHLTPRAVDEGDSSAPEGDTSPEVLSAGEAGSTPALHH